MVLQVKLKSAWAMVMPVITVKTATHVTTVTYFWALRNVQAIQDKSFGGQDAAYTSHGLHVIQKS
jgi:hypothetical protein